MLLIDAVDQPAESGFIPPPAFDNYFVDKANCLCNHGSSLIPALDRDTGALPPGDHPAKLGEIAKRFGFTPHRKWLLKGLRAAVKASWAAGITEIYIDGSFCTEKPDPGDVDGYWVEPDPEVYARIDPYWINFELVFIPHLRKWKWRMWAEHGVEFFIHPVMHARPGSSFPEFFRRDREGRPRGVIHIIKAGPS